VKPEAVVDAMLLIQDKVLISKESAFVFVEDTHEYVRRKVRDSPIERGNKKRRRPRRTSGVAPFSGTNMPKTGDHPTARLVFPSPRATVYNSSSSSSSSSNSPVRTVLTTSRSKSDVVESSDEEEEEKEGSHSALLFDVSVQFCLSQTRSKWLLYNTVGIQSASPKTEQ
jgi:hypothetical protein